ncbi:SDR family NAD(P)-dependent oxidoreductase [Halobellus salinisoli]|uniref:SDR family NAD(P)-dependent oxidoreductase n=1 Tax=Halobellus salinisoli TaxID=3108500 RepID=UPI00300B6600
MIDLSGETAIVTGAAQGFGAEIATQLGEAGANVVLADVQVEKGQGVAADIADDGAETIFVECDVTDRDSAEALVEAAQERFGTVEILVNNAGGAGGETFQEIEADAWQFGLDLNLTGPFNCSKAVMPGMLEHGNGRIVNISSMAGRNVTVNGNPSYTASKWGLIGLTKHAARDLGPDIRVNALCPGGSPRGPMGRFVEPEDVANGVLYLVSDLSEFVDGTILEVEGGGHLNPSAEDLDLDYETGNDDS